MKFYVQKAHLHYHVVLQTCIRGDYGGISYLVSYEMAFIVYTTQIIIL